MFAWAEKRNGKLDGREFAQAIRKSGHSKATTDQSAMATITNFAVRAYADYWTKTGPNQFQRKYPETEEVQEPREDVQEPENPMESETLDAG